MKTIDPMEKLIANALNAKHLHFFTESHPLNRGLDFYIPSLKLHIEVKQFHSHRIADQMAAVDNVIVAQGRGAVELLAKTIMGTAW